MPRCQYLSWNPHLLGGYYSCLRRWRQLISQVIVGKITQIALRPHLATHITFSRLARHHVWSRLKLLLLNHLEPLGLVGILKGVVGRSLNWSLNPRLHCRRHSISWWVIGHTLRIVIYESYWLPLEPMNSLDHIGVSLRCKNTFLWLHNWPNDRMLWY